MFFHCRTVIDDLFFFRSQIAERYIGVNPHLAAHIGHQRPHQAVPWGDRALVDAEGIIRHKARQVHGADAARPAAGLTGALGVEGEFLGRRCVKMRAALRADQFLPGRNSQGRLQIMPIRAAVAGQPGKHQPQAVQQFRSRAEGTADTRHAGTLMKCQRCGNIQRLVHAGPGRLCHPSAGIGGERFEIPARPFRIQHAQRQRGFAGAGHTRNSHNFTQRNIYINVFKVVDFCATNQHFINHTWPHRLFLVSSESLRAAVLQLNPFYGSR